MVIDNKTSKSAFIFMKFSLGRKNEDLWWSVKVIASPQESYF